MVVSSSATAVGGQCKSHKAPGSRSKREKAKSDKGSKSDRIGSKSNKDRSKSDKSTGSKSDKGAGSKSGKSNEDFYKRCPDLLAKPSKAWEGTTGKATAEQAMSFKAPEDRVHEVLESETEKGGKSTSGGRRRTGRAGNGGEERGPGVKHYRRRTPFCRRRSRPSLYCMPVHTSLPPSSPGRCAVLIADSRLLFNSRVQRVPDRTVVENSPPPAEYLTVTVKGQLLITRSNEGTLRRHRICQKKGRTHTTRSNSGTVRFLKRARENGRIDRTVASCARERQGPHAVPRPMQSSCAQALSTVTEVDPGAHRSLPVEAAGSETGEGAGSRPSQHAEARPPGTLPARALPHRGRPCD